MATRAPQNPSRTHTPAEDRAMRFIVAGTVFLVALSAALGSALS